MAQSCSCFSGSSAQGEKAQDRNFCATLVESHQALTDVISNCLQQIEIKFLEGKPSFHLPTVCRSLNISKTYLQLGENHCTAQMSLVDLVIPVAIA